MKRLIAALLRGKRLFLTYPMKNFKFERANLCFNFEK
jgi:hypothetical protein